jgi:hypothetical protein
MLAVLLLGYNFRVVNGAALGAASISLALFVECVYSRWIFSLMKHSSEWELDPLDPLSYRGLTKFYAPLACTGILGIVRRPIGSAAIGRMPLATESLAAVGAAYSIIALLMAVSYSLLELVVARVRDTELRPLLWRFIMYVVGSMALLLVIITLTPLQNIVLRDIIGLSPNLFELSGAALPLMALAPLCIAVQAYYEGVLLIRKTTRKIIEANCIGLFAFCALLLLGVCDNTIPGASVFGLAVSLNSLLLMLWLMYCSREKK